MSGPAQIPPATTVQFTQETPTQHAGSTGRLTRQTPWRARRYTPYAKTPATRALRTVKRTGTERGIVRTPSKELPGTSEHTLNELLGNTWHVHRVSPLYKFTSKNGDLRHYSRVLSAYLLAESYKGLAVETSDDKANSAVFSTLKGLTKSNDEPEAVQIQLKQKSDKATGEVRVVAKAILCSVGASEESLQRVTAPFVALPVLLYRGPVTLKAHLTQWLQGQFDCVIHPVRFNPMAMCWMVAMWSGTTLPEKKGNSVLLQYRVPDEVEGLDRISMSIEPKDCKVLWDCVHPDKEESFHQNEVITFIKSLEEHFYRHFRINIGAMSLCRVGTSIACVGAEGKLKIFSPEYVHQVLGHVTEVIIETNSILR